MPRYVVRHGVMRQLGVFSTRGGDRFSRGTKVIARTGRGQECGEVLCDATAKVQAKMPDARTGQILRAISHEDEVELRKIEEQSARDLETCRQRVADLGLAMNLVDAERIYGGERVVFYYLAESRVDFRELVKQLARELQTRVELRQIGVRDEAKLLADYGDCGKPVCCNTHLPEMPPVSMKMAKLQKATLDPSKISGRCGRLKCCLRYEYDTYRQMQQDLPRVGAEIITTQGRVKVLAQEILAGQVLVQTEDMRRMVVGLDAVLSVLPSRRKEQKAESDDGPKASGAAERRPPSPRRGKLEFSERQRAPKQQSSAQQSSDSAEQHESAHSVNPPEQAGQDRASQNQTGRPKQAADPSAEAAADGSSRPNAGASRNPTQERNDRDAGPQPDGPDG